MRSLWNGSLSFGLINIPVELYSATQESGLDFDLLHRDDHCPIRYARVCREDGREIPWNEIVKGYEYKKGDYIVFDEKDFEKASPPKTNTIDIVSFTKEESVDSKYFEKPYYLAPQKGAGKAYQLFREALEKTKKAGIATFILREREHLALVRPDTDSELLLVNQLRFDEELRDSEEIEPKQHARVSTKELDMAVKLINQLSEEFRAGDFKDTYSKKLKKIITDRARGKKDTPTVHYEPIPTNVDDLLKALEESLSKRKKVAK